MRNGREIMTSVTFSPERARANASFEREGDAFDVVDGPGRAVRDEFEFEALKDPRIDWGAIARCDSREARRRTDIDALESVLEVCVRADIDSVTNQEMCEPKRGRELAKLLQLLVEYLLHVQEALSESKARAERESEGWKERAKRERDECRKMSRELRLAHEAHEAELIAVAAEYAKRRNNPDSAELEDARRRGESMAAERAAKDLEKRLREQRELFDAAVDRMRAAHAEAQAEAARELAARKAELAAARAQYVATSAESTNEATRMIAEAQDLIREAREKAELEKANVSRIRAELNSAVEAQQRHKRAVVDAKLELTRLQEDLKYESEANAELRTALERRDEERKIMREQIERLQGKQSSSLREEMAELTSVREVVKNNYAEIERLKRENEVLRQDKESKSTWVAEEKKRWVSANEQILQAELTEKDDVILELREEISQLRAELATERSKKLVTIRPIIEEYEVRSKAPPSPKPAAPLPMPASLLPKPESPKPPTPTPVVDAAKPKRKTLEVPPVERKVEDMEGALNAIMLDIDVDLEGADVGGLDDEAFQAAMLKLESAKLRDIPNDPKLRAKYMEARDRVLKEVDSIGVR